MLMKTEVNSEISDSPGWIPAIDGLRALAVLAVMVHHINGGQFAGTAVAHLGVVTFFSMSGFLAYYILANDERRFGKIDYNFFLYRRIIRIWPAYLVTIWLCWLTFTPTVPQTSAAWWPLFTFTSNWYIAAFREWPPGPLSPLWSIAVEEQFYLLAPLMYRALRSRYAVAFCFTILIASNAGRYAYISANSGQGGNGGLYYTTYAYIDTFLAGAVVAHLRSTGRMEIGRVTQWISFALSAVGIVWLVRFWGPLISPPYATISLFPYVVIPPVCGLLLLSVSGPYKTSFVAVLGSRPFRLIALISFELYLIHLLPVGIIDTFTSQFIPAVDDNSRYEITAVVLAFIFVRATVLFTLISFPARLLKRYGPLLTARIPWPAVLLLGAFFVGVVQYSL